MMDCCLLLLGLLHCLSYAAFWGQDPIVRRVVTGFRLLVKMGRTAAVACVAPSLESRADVTSVEVEQRLKGAHIKARVSFARKNEAIFAIFQADFGLGSCVFL